MFFGYNYSKEEKEARAAREAKKKGIFDGKCLLAKKSSPQYLDSAPSGPLLLHSLFSPSSSVLCLASPTQAPAIDLLVIIHRALDVGSGSDLVQHLLCSLPSAFLHGGLSSGALGESLAGRAQRMSVTLVRS